MSFPVGERIPVEGETGSAKLRRSGRPERVDDYDDVESELAERLREFGIRSVVGAPIYVAGHLWGAVMVSSQLAHAFPAGTEVRIGSFAELVTAALADVDAREQLAASRARIVEAADAARRRIERDLHDGAQQRLVSLALSLLRLESELEPNSPATRELEVARAELDAALEELRELARGIHPSILTDRGLEAADAARRRIERDLHDGAQQRLVALALHLRRIESSLEPNSAATHELAVARAELNAALAELRELARGIHPSILTDRGLEAALTAVAGRSPVPVELDLAGCDKLPLTVQTTAYFVVVEAVTNASKHADPDRIEVRVDADDDSALLEVRDDGGGGVDLARGSGLRGLADRVSALSGTLEIESPPGAGTTIRARLPV